jgi:hypothetical protein
LDGSRAVEGCSRVDHGVRCILFRNGGLRGEQHLHPTSCGLGRKIFQVFTGCPPFKNLLPDVAIVKIIMGEQPPRPQSLERLGLDDEVWKQIQECWSFEPKSRPAIKDVQSFLKPLYQKWIPLMPKEINDLNPGPPERIFDDSTEDWTSEVLGGPSAERSNAVREDGYDDYNDSLWAA